MRGTRSRCVCVCDYRAGGEMGGKIGCVSPDEVSKLVSSGEISRDDVGVSRR